MAKGPPNRQEPLVALKELFLRGSVCSLWDIMLLENWAPSSVSPKPSRSRPGEKTGFETDPGDFVHFKERLSWSSQYLYIIIR